jgi:hypothetical protein
MGVDKEGRFNRVAIARKQKIIDMLRLLGNCSNNMNYKYTDEQAIAIFEEIDRELADAKKKFDLH